MLKRLLFLLLFFSLSILNVHAKVDTLTIQSASMKKTLKAGVVTPENYQNKKGSFPVLYLLHGYSGNFSNWLKVPPQKDLLQSMADKYQLIIVTPDGSYSSWYLNSPVDPASQYETFITRELVQAIDSQYSTIINKTGRFISGLSMGGHGALYLAARNPDLYLAAGSMSGAVDISDIDKKKLLENNDRARLIKSIEAVLGSNPDNPKHFREHSILYMLPQLKKSEVRFIIDCGVDDFLIEDNRELHRRMVLNKIPHEYIERPGNHSWTYWGNALENHLLFFQKAGAEMRGTTEQ